MPFSNLYPLLNILQLQLKFYTNFKMFDSSIWGSKWKTSSGELQKINTAISQIKQSQNPRFHENIQRILVLFFGKYQSVGILQKFTKDFVHYRPLEWAVELQKMLDLIGPKSYIFGKIVQNKDIRLPLNNSYLPSHIEPASMENNIPKCLELKKTYQGFSAPMLDAYLIMLMRAICDSDYSTCQTSQFQNLTLDNVFASLSRNSLLVLLKKILEYFSTKKNQLIKIVSVFKMYMADQIISKFDQDKINDRNNDIHRNRNSFQDSNSLSNKYYETNTQNSQRKLRYKLKSHHILTTMLMIKYTQNLSENILDVGKYFLSLTENFKQLNPDKQCFHILIRGWVYSVINKNRNNVESQVISVLEKANIVDGWFYLKRYRPQQIVSSENFNYTNLSIARLILKLLNSDNNWSPQTIYIFTLACFFNLLKSCNVFFSQNENERRISSSHELQKSEHKSLKKIFTRINSNLDNIFRLMKKTNSKQLKDAQQLIDGELCILQSYANQFQSSNNKNRYSAQFRLPQVSGQYKFKRVDLQLIKPQKSSSQANQIIAGENNYQMSSIQSKRRLITFYRREDRGCWQIPIQYNQSVFLYYLFYTVAKLIDFFIPGNRSSPRLNIRFLANPLTFAGMLIIFIIFYLFLWK